MRELKRGKAGMAAKRGHRYRWWFCGQWEIKGLGDSFLSERLCTVWNSDERLGQVEDIKCLWGKESRKW